MITDVEAPGTPQPYHRLAVLGAGFGPRFLRPAGELALVLLIAGPLLVITVVVFNRLDLLVGLTLTGALPELGARGATWWTVAGVVSRPAHVCRRGTLPATSTAATAASTARPANTGG